MATTLLQARTAVRERLDESSARQWKDTMLNRWIYEGMQDVARKTEVLQAEVDIACDASAQRVDAPENMLRLYRVVWKNDSDTTQQAIPYKAFNNADAVWWTSQAITEGIPAMYTMWGVPGSVKIILYPTPAEDGTLSLQYYRLPIKPGVDSDTLDIPMGWEDLVYSWAEMRALKQDRDPRWQESKAEYDEQLGAMFDLTRHYTDQQGQEIQPEGYGGLPAWLTMGGDW